MQPNTILCGNSSKLMIRAFRSKFYSIGLYTFLGKVRASKSQSYGHVTVKFTLFAMSYHIWIRDLEQQS